MKVQHDVVQGSNEWIDLRAKFFTASDAPAMLGMSKYKSRSELLREKATGIVPQVDAATQARFDAGHAAEGAAWHLVEDKLRTELFSVTLSDTIEGLPLLASYDGLSMDGSVVWENKLRNKSNGDVEKTAEEHWPQLEQQALIAGVDRVYFTTSDGTAAGTAGCWYWSKPERRAQLIAGWKQFKTDLDAYQYVPSAPEPVAAPIETLPALMVQVEGRVLTTNLDQFALTAKNFIANIKTELSTDQDFADADKMTKFLKDGEDKLELVKTQALSQTADIDALFRTIDSLKEEMRAKRLTLSKIVDNRKVSIRVEIQESGNKAVREHLDALNKRIGKPYMPDKKWADFVTAMRGKKTITSLRSAVNDEIARFKIDANEIADRIQTNLNSLRDMADGFQFLFADTAQIVLKQNDDLVALIKTRIAEHKESEAAKKERERLAQEELQRRATAEQERIATAANAVLAKAVEDTVVVGDISSNVGALSIAPGKVEIIPGTSIYNMPVAAPDEAQMMRTAGEMLDDILVNMHITNIRRRDARRIAELLGGGAVVWENGRCYPTSEACCTIVLAERTPNLASARK